MTLPPPPEERRPEPTLPDPGRERRDPPEITVRLPEYTEDEPGDPKAAAVTFDVIVGLVLIVIGVWCTWHNGPSDEGIEYRVVVTWVWVCLVPAFALTAWAFVVAPSRK